MSLPLQGKRIVLDVTGSIEAHKAADLTNRLRKKGADVFLILTSCGAKFITALTLQTLARHPVAEDLWSEANSWQPGHIELADNAYLVVVAPFTAIVLAQFAQGLAPDYLSSLYLVARCPISIGPAMNGKMRSHSVTLNNVPILKSRGVDLIGPEEGLLACGHEGLGVCGQPTAIWPASSRSCGLRQVLGGGAARSGHRQKNLLHRSRYRTLSSLARCHA